MKMLDVVALKQARPDLGLAQGEAGTIVEVFQDAFLVEFSDDDGQEYAMPFLRPDEIDLIWTPEEGYLTSARVQLRKAAG